VSFIVPLYCKCLDKKLKRSKRNNVQISSSSFYCLWKLLSKAATYFSWKCLRISFLSEWFWWVTTTLRHTAQHIWETLKTWKAHHHKNQHKTPMRYSRWFVSTVNSALWNVFVPLSSSHCFKMAQFPLRQAFYHNKLIYSVLLYYYVRNRDSFFKDAKNHTGSHFTSQMRYWGVLSKWVFH